MVHAHALNSVTIVVEASIAYNSRMFFQEKTSNEVDYRLSIIHVKHISQSKRIFLVSYLAKAQISLLSGEILGSLNSRS